jgi:hypothetical protein
MLYLNDAKVLTFLPITFVLSEINFEMKIIAEKVMPFTNNLYLCIKFQLQSLICTLQSLQHILRSLQYKLQSLKQKNILVVWQIM